MSINTPKGQQLFGSIETQGMSLKEYLFLFRRGHRLIILSVVLIALIAIYYTFTVNPVYKASSTILIVGPERVETMFGMGGQAEISNMNEMLKSRSVAMGVVEELWNSEYRNQLEIFGTRVYRPKGERVRRMYREIISFGRYDPLNDIPAEYNEPYSREIGGRYVRHMQARIRVSRKPDTELLDITCTSPFKGEAALLANTFAEVFRKLDREWKAEESFNTRSFLEDQIKIKEAELKAAEDTLEAFQEKEKIFSIESSAANILDKAVEIEAILVESQAEVNIKTREQEYIQSRLSEEEKSLVDQLQSSINSRLLALRVEIGKQEAELIRSVGLYGPEHDAVKTQQSKIDQLKRNLDTETEALISQGLSVVDPLKYREDLISQLFVPSAEISSLEARVSEYERVLDQYNEKLNQLPSRQLQFSRLLRDREVLSEIYGFMRQKLEESSISVASESGAVRIIDRAIAPSGASSPDHVRNIILGLILGLGLGVGIVLLREMLDTTVRSIDYIERLGLTLLGVIPKVGQQYISRKKGRLADTSAKNTDSIGTLRKGTRESGQQLRWRLITREDPKSPVSEAYRMIRTNIMYSQAGDKIKSIIVSSPGPGEGKSTTITNLAITFANLGKKTLLVDTDLRKPVIHSIFEFSKEPGLTHYLTGQENDYTKLLHKTEIENLYVISSGITPPNPSELLGSSRMDELILALEEEYDIVLFDSPPIVAVTDAVMVSRKIKSFVLVVKAGQTSKETLQRAKQALEGIETPLSGVVLNGVTKDNSSDTSYYYYQNYYQYYGDNS